MTILEKRTADDRLFDIDCSKLLDADETINAVGIITADGTTGLTFGTGVVNTQAVSYTDDETGITRTVAIGKVVQVRIRQGRGEAVVAAIADPAVPPGVVRLSAAHASTCGLEGLAGPIQMERA